MHLVTNGFSFPAYEWSAERERRPNLHGHCLGEEHIWDSLGHKTGSFCFSVQKVEFLSIVRKTRQNGQTNRNHGRVESRKVLALHPLSWLLRPGSTLYSLSKCYTKLTLMIVYIQMCLHCKPRATYENEHVVFILSIFPWILHFQAHPFLTNFIFLFN